MEPPLPFIMIHIHPIHSPDEPAPLPDWKAGSLARNLLISCQFLRVAFEAPVVTQRQEEQVLTGFPTIPSAVYQTPAGPRFPTMNVPLKPYSGFSSDDSTIAPGGKCLRNLFYRYVSSGAQLIANRPKSVIHDKKSQEREKEAVG